VDERTSDGGPFWAVVYKRQETCPVSRARAAGATRQSPVTKEKSAFWCGHFSEKATRISRAPENPIKPSTQTAALRWSPPNCRNLQPKSTFSSPSLLFFAPFSGVERTRGQTPFSLVKE